MCKVLHVSRSSYYAWVNKTPSERAKENERLSIKIKEIFVNNRLVYGTRRLKKALEAQGFNVSRRRIGRLMRQCELQCKTSKKFKNTSNSNHKSPVADNLLNREFCVNVANKSYAGDITYIRTKEGWLYLAVVIDLFSRKIVGWAMSNKIDQVLVNQALLMAIKTRKPEIGLIWHTDRGSQYASDSHKLILQKYGIKQSMSRKGNCWDNAVSESFFHTLKTELIYTAKYTTREEAKCSIFEYIEVFYNKKRLHSANNYLSPADYESMCLNV